jgi:hypothetical protein
MKRLNFIAAIASLIIAAGCGDTHNATGSGSYSTSNMAYITAPTSVQTSFTARYPSATNVRWSYYDNSVVPIDWDLTDWQVLTPQDYTVSYDMDGNQYYSWYDANGNWIGSSYATTNYSALPPAVNTMITDQYPGYTITGVQNESWRDRSAYQVELKNDAMKVKLLVDANGTVLKQKSREL